MCIKVLIKSEALHSVLQLDGSCDYICKVFERDAWLHLVHFGVPLNALWIDAEDSTSWSMTLIEPELGDCLLKLFSFGRNVVAVTSKTSILFLFCISVMNENVWMLLKCFWTRSGESRSWPRVVHLLTSKLYLCNSFLTCDDCCWCWS